MVDVLHHHLARMYGTFVFNLIYCRLPSSIAGREDFSTERGTFCFSLFIFLVSFHKEHFQFCPFFSRYSYPILDYSNNALASNCWWNVSLWFPLWWNNYGIFFSKIFVIIFILSFIFKGFIVVFILSLIFKVLLSLHLLIFILFFRLSLKTLKISNLPCQIPCLDRFCKIYSQFPLLEPFPI